MHNLLISLFNLFQLHLMSELCWQYASPPYEWHMLLILLSEWDIIDEYKWSEHLCSMLK